MYADNPDYIMLYVCKKYPVCDAYIRTQKGTAIPIGVMANGKLRALRTDVHKRFDQLHLKHYMSKNTDYAWLSSILSVPYKKAHIGLLIEMQCELVIRETKKLLSWHESHKNNSQRRYKNYDTDANADAGC